MDHGTETGVMATMHCYIRSKQGVEEPTETDIFGKSSSNQVSYSLDMP